MRNFIVPNMTTNMTTNKLMKIMINRKKKQQQRKRSFFRRFKHILVIFIMYSVRGRGRGAETITFKHHLSCSGHTQITFYIGYTWKGDVSGLNAFAPLFR